MLHQNAGSQYNTGCASTGGLGVILDRPEFYNKTQNVFQRHFVNYVLMLSLGSIGSPSSDI